MIESPVPPVSAPKVLWRQPAVWHLLLVALLAEIAYAVLNISTMPVYLAANPGPPSLMLAEGRGMGSTVIGFVLAAFLFSEAVFKSPMGALADRVGPRKLMLIGPSISAVTSLLTMAIPHRSGGWEVLALILLRVADGVGAAMLWPACFARMGSAAPDTQRQQAMSLLNLCYILGVALALPIGGAVNDLSGHRYASLFLSALMFSGVTLAVWRFVPAGRGSSESSHEDSPHDEAHSSDAHAKGLGDLLRAFREIPEYLALALVTFAGVGFPMAVVKLFAQQELNMSESAFGALVLPAALAMATLSVPLSRFGEKLGKARAVHIGLALCAGGMALISVGAFVPAMRSPWTFVVSGLPVGLGFLLTIPAWMASVSDIDSRRRATNIGAVMTAQGLGAILGMPIGSALYEKLAPSGTHLAHYSPFIGCAICTGLGWLLSLKVLKHRPDGSRP